MHACLVGLAFQLYVREQCEGWCEKITAVGAGHYVSFIKSSEHWLLLDDELVDVVNESHVQQAFGTTQEYNSTAEHGYILLYERR